MKSVFRNFFSDLIRRNCLLIKSQEKQTSACLYMLQDESLCCYVAFSACLRKVWLEGGCCNMRIPLFILVVLTITFIKTNIIKI